MPRVVIVVVVVMLMIYCVVDIAMSGPFKVRLMPRWLWLAAVICLPLVGSAAWLIFGRPRVEPPPKKPTAPDDDPDFLRRL
ncbi:PLD nuclease N-terminal domain-containing protein [Propionicicella superfundia]|uniref:PLD nuclease N-terminal domain-containing protein n=1 Tax=Propionicicella superfundia TaxID=348582 RepID=UPI00048B216F|nr:PLD nuclease N-terminal domain-containing protein [Propionicicella superfundia]